MLDCRLNGESRDGVLLWMVVFTPALRYLVGVAIAGPFLLAEWLKRRSEVAGQLPDGRPHAPGP